MITVQEIQGYPLFAGLTERELAPIAALCDRRSHEKDAVIFDPGAVSEDIFIL